MEGPLLLDVSAGMMIYIMISNPVIIEIGDLDHDHDDINDNADHDDHDYHVHDHDGDDDAA